MTVEKKLTGYPSIDKPWLKFYSDEAINADIPEMSIYEWIRMNNVNNHCNVAVNYLGYKITYGKLFQNIENAASAFSIF